MVMGETMAEAAATNWLDVLRSGLWPLFALIALIILGAPAIKILNNVGDGGAQEIEAGPIKIKFSAEGLRHIPPPSAAVANALPKLTQGEVDALMAHAPNSGIPICRPESSLLLQPDGEKPAVYDKLSAEGLVSFTNPSANTPNTSWCRIEGLKMAELTETGKSVRTYLLSIITSSITISPS